MKPIKIILPVDLINQRIDLALTKVFPEYSRSQLIRFLKMGKIKVNNHLCKPKTKILGGETISFDYIEVTQPSMEPENIPLQISFEDEHLLIINKPANLVVHPGAGNYGNTLVNGLLFYDINLAKLPRAGIIHRLDKDTTGLLIIAKTNTSYQKLIQQMQAREIKREYLALAHGKLRCSGTISTAFGRHPHNRLKMAVKINGKEAITNYQIIKTFSHFTLLNVSLITGRTHQIRVHMAHLKHPLAGDQMYGKKHIPASINLPVRNLLSNFKRQALHAHKLSFLHPTNQQLIQVTAPLPEDFEKLLNSLEENE